MQEHLLALFDEADVVSVDGYGNSIHVNTFNTENGDSIELCFSNNKELWFDINDFKFANKIDDGVYDMIESCTTGSNQLVRFYRLEKFDKPSE